MLNSSIYTIEYNGLILNTYGTWSKKSEIEAQRVAMFDTERKATNKMKKVIADLAFRTAEFDKGRWPNLQKHPQEIQLNNQHKDIVVHASDVQVICRTLKLLYEEIVWQLKKLSRIA